MILEFNRTRECTRHESAVMNSSAAVRFGPQPAVTSIALRRLRKMSNNFLEPHFQALLALVDRMEQESAECAPLAAEARKHLRSIEPWLSAPPVQRPTRLREGNKRYADILRDEVLPKSPDHQIAFDSFVETYGLSERETSHLKKSLAMARGIVYDKATGLISLPAKSRKAM